MFRKILVFLLIALIAIQFFHPKKNRTKDPQPNYIGTKFSIPADVQAILKKACYDCHSNNTRYPWYAYVQPVAWWLNGHIKNGKKGMNLDDYTTRSLRYQFHKMEDIEEQLKENKMPLKSYLWVHKDARLTDEEKNKLLAWTNAVRDTMRAIYPADSLIRKKQP